MPEFSLTSGLYPKVICSTCRRTLVENSRGGARKFPPLMLDYGSFYPRGSRTSGHNLVLEPGAICGCQLCQVGRMTLGYPEWHAAHSNHPGSPPNPTTVEVHQLCAKCGSQVGRGLPHDCTRSTKRDNLESMIRANSGDTQSQVKQVSVYLDFAAISAVVGHLKDC